MAEVGIATPVAGAAAKSLPPRAVPIVALVALLKVGVIVTVAP